MQAGGFQAIIDALNAHRTDAELCQQVRGALLSVRSNDDHRIPVTEQSRILAHSHLILTVSKHSCTTGHVNVGDRSSGPQQH